jgi:hypothetical protein
MGSIILRLDIWLLSVTLGSNRRYLRKEADFYSGVFLGYHLLCRQCFHTY